MTRNRLSIFDLLVGTDALRQAFAGALMLGIYSLLPVWKEHSVLHRFADHSPSVYIGPEILLGLLLVLRTNSAYQRWWEARMLWGKLVNISRNFVIKTESLASPPLEEQRSIRDHVSAFSYELRDHLRGTTRSENGNELKRHVPGNRVLEIYRTMNQWRRDGLISDDLLRILDSETREFLEVCGGCERILNTPLSKSYRVFLHQCVLLVLITLPWSLADSIGFWTIPVMIIHAYCFLGIEEVALAIEEPFGTATDDLDLDTICQTIETTI